MEAKEIMETLGSHKLESQSLAFDLSSYLGLKNQNLFEKDKTLQFLVASYTKDLPSQERSDIEKHLFGYGKLVGGILNELTDRCHKEGKYPEVQKYDRVGNRIDEIIYSPEQLESRRISYEYGVVNLDFDPEWKYPFRPIHRYALAYLMNLNGEGGVACPLAMTDGMILVLQKLGTEEQKQKYLPIVAGKGSSSHFLAGQYVTERVGGSNVSANRTTARLQSNGKYVLNGEKWFCSNPGDLWVTTAKIEGTNTIGLFLVPRYKENGELNGHHILRKKDIIGSRGKATVEIIYENLEADALGRTTHGIANLIRYVIRVSRLHVGLGSCANAKRAVLEAMEYSQVRTAYGKRIIDFPILATELASLQVLQSLNTMLNFRSVDYFQKNDILEEVLLPLLKYKSTLQASDLTRRSMLVLGGNGIVGDFSPLPRLHNDSIINETWEGTHLVISEHVLHALRKERIFRELKKRIDGLLLDTKAKKSSELFPKEKLVISIVEAFASVTGFLKDRPKSWQDLHRLRICDQLYQVFCLMELLNWGGSDSPESYPINELAIGYLELLHPKEGDIWTALGSSGIAKLLKN